METERQGWIKFLDDNDWNLESCRQALLYSIDGVYGSELSEDQESLLSGLDNRNNLKPYINMLLDNMFVIPGITITERTSITQIKR